MEWGAGAIAGAAGEGGLPLAGQALGDGVAQHVAGVGSQVGRGVEHLVGAGAGVGAAGDVADRVAARLAGGEAHASQKPHHLRRIVQVHEVKLEVLASGDVAAAVAGVLLGDDRAGLHLVGGDTAIRQFDADHLHVLLALAVDAVHQTEGAELVHKPFLVGAEAAGLALEVLDLLLQGDENAAGLEVGRHGGVGSVGIAWLLFNLHKRPPI